MPNTGGFDIMLQFKQDIINDILVRHKQYYWSVKETR